MPLNSSFPPTNDSRSLASITGKLWSEWSSRRVGLVVGAAFLLPSLATIWNMHERCKRFLTDDLKSDLSVAAKTVANVVDPVMHKTFTDPKQEESPEYNAAIGKLRMTRALVDPKAMIKFVYTCVEKDGEIHFVLDDTPEGDADHDGVDDKSHIMEVYKDASEPLRVALRKGTTEVNDTPYKDKWGTFMSGYSPVFDAQHHVVAVAGVDLALNDYYLQLSALRFVAILSVIGASSLAFIAGLGMARYHRTMQVSIDKIVELGDAAMAASRAKSDFLASMSHELRTPMNAIIGHADLLASSVLGSDQRGSVAAVHKAAEALTVMLTDIIDYASIDATSLVIERKPVSVGVLLGELRVAFEPEIQAKGLALVMRAVGDCPERVLTDHMHLSRMLRHLMANAVKFSNHGTITVEARYEDGSLRFSVKDEGVGIAEEQRDKLFTAFGLGDASSTRKHGGAGIGLALCKRICEAMKGRIWVDSEPGKGSTFYVSIPVDEVPPPSDIVLITRNNLTTILVRGVVEKMNRTLRVVAGVSEAEIGSQDIVLWDVAVEWSNSMRGRRVIALNADDEELPEGLVEEVLTSPLKPAKLRQLLEAR